MTGETGKRRLLIADDHILVRDAVAEVVRHSSDFEVLIADSLRAAVESIRSGDPVDVILLDLNMPDMEGIRSVETMVKAAGDGSVVLFSGYASKDVVLQAISLGARGFIPKNMRLGALLNALNLVAEGEIYLPATLLRGDRSARAAQSGESSEIQLNEKESEVLHFVAAGMQNKEIAWQMNTTEVRVKMHMRSLCKKLGVTNRTGAAVKAKELGIC